jgi:hypothetical protein
MSWFSGERIREKRFNAEAQRCGDAEEECSIDNQAFLSFILEPLSLQNDAYCSL